MTSDAVSAAGAAPGLQDWGAVHSDLVGARDGLSTGDLGLLAEAAWWIGNGPESIEVAEDLYHRLVAEGRTELAADCALRLSLLWVVRGDVPLGTAWLSRARRVIAEGAPAEVRWEVAADANFRAPLKAEGLLTRDPRMKERKKYGQPGARKRFQFSKR